MNKKTLSQQDKQALSLFAQCAASSTYLAMVLENLQAGKMIMPDGMVVDIKEKCK